MRNVRTVFVYTLAALLAIAPAGHGSVIVFDPTNFAVNVEQVAHHLELIARLEQQIRNQLRMLESWQFTRLDQLLSSMERIRGTVEEAAEVDLVDLYSIAASAYERLDAKAIRERRRTWLESQRDAVMLGRTAQERVIAELPATLGRVGEYVREAQHAPGQTAVLQATNETIATLAGQLQSLQALELAEIRVELEEEAQRQAEAALRHQRREQLMRDWTDATAGTVEFVGAAPVQDPFMAH